MPLCKLAEIRISEICEVTSHEAGFNLLTYFLNNKFDKFFIESLKFLLFSQQKNVQYILPQK
jgi:hypothetical protein